MKRVLLSLGLVIACSSLALADNWPNWRGPQGTGVADGKSYPTEWSSVKNVKWKVKLPGGGASTPIVWEDRIFLTYGDDGANTVACLDRGGKTQWTAEVGKERAGKHKKATGSNPSVATDGEHLFAYFKSGDLACLNFSGELLWHTNLQDKYGEDTLWWDLGTSPVVTKDHVIVAVMQTGPSYLVAFDKETGDVAWKQDRNLGAPEEAAQSYSTPSVVEHEGRQILVVLGADHVTAHDALTGKELWRVGGLNPTGHKFFRSIASAVVSDGMVVAPYARAATVTGIKLGGSGNVTKTHVAWFRDDLGTDVPTPAALDGKCYLCTDKGAVHCLDINTGDTLWVGEVQRHRDAYSASPVVAGGHVYVTREDGKCFVFKTEQKGDKAEPVAANELDGAFVVATPVFVDGQILIRTLEHLYCIEE